MTPTKTPQNGAPRVTVVKSIEAPELDAETRSIAARDDDPPKRHALLVRDVARQPTPPIRCYPTGIAELDALIGGGISTRQLLSVLGPPGAGKSAWAVSTSIHIAPTLPVLYASTELEQHELMARIAGNLLDRPWSAIVRGNIPQQWVDDALRDVRIRIIGCDVLPRDGNRALALIEAEILAETREGGIPPLVVIDYLQDLARGSDRDVRSRIGDLATDLRAMSQRLDCAIVSVSSVARSYYSDKRAAELRSYDDPTVYLAAAKECGDIDYASAAVVFLDVDKPGEAADRAARIAVAKSRHGSPGFAGARFTGASGRWFAAPEAVGELSGPGRAAGAGDAKLDEADKAVLAMVERLHSTGKRALCTKSQLRTGCGIGTDRALAALDRLELAGRLRIVEVERQEGGKTKRREVYEPIGSIGPGRTAGPLELDLAMCGAGIHGGMP